MSPGGSKQMRDLFAAARADGPDAETRDALWDRLSVATGAGTAAAGAKAAAEAASAAKTSADAAAGVKVVGTSAGAVKLVAAGAAAGALLTGLGVVAVVVASEPLTHSVSARAPTVRAREDGRASGTELATAPARPKIATVSPAAVAEAPGGGVAPVSAPARNAESALAEEARLLTDARRALVRGDADAALARIEEAKQLRTRALEPEQMGIEARALRAAGRADEAAAVELRLRARYPEHALAK